MIWMTRFQLRTAASRASSSGPDQRSTGSTEAMPTPASAQALRNFATRSSSARGWLKNGMKSAVRRQLQVLVAQFGHHAGNSSSS